MKNKELQEKLAEYPDDFEVLAYKGGDGRLHTISIWIDDDDDSTWLDFNLDGKTIVIDCD
jgi:hypothetical protein